MARGQQRPNTPLKTARLRLKLTQKEAAARIGMSYRHYQDVENWDAMPGIILAFRIADCLGTSVLGLWEPLYEASRSVTPEAGGPSGATREEGRTGRV